MDAWFEYTKVVLRALRAASISGSAPCHTRFARVARSACSGDVPLVPPLGAPLPCYTCCAFCKSNRTDCQLWTRLEGEDEESEEEEEEGASANDGDEEEQEETEEEEEDETAHSKKQAQAAPKKPKREEGHSEDDPEDNPVVPEKVLRVLRVFREGSTVHHAGSQTGATHNGREEEAEVRGAEPAQGATEEVRGGDARGELRLNPPPPPPKKTHTVPCAMCPWRCR